MAEPGRKQVIVCEAQALGLAHSRNLTNGALATVAVSFVRIEVLRYY